MRVAGVVGLFVAAGIGLGGVAAADGGPIDVGIVVLPAPGTTTSPPAPTTPPVSPSPIVSGVFSPSGPAPVPSSPSAAAAPTGVGGGSLPNTGSDPAGPIMLAAVLLAAGTVLTVVARRRH